MPNNNITSNSADKSFSAEKSSVRSTDLQHEVKTAARQAASQVQESARGAVATAKETVAHVGEETGALIHDAREAVADGYESARDYAVDVAHDTSELAQRASRQTVDYVRRANLATGRFATVHALPLSVLGASLGWLAWSIRRDARRPARRSVIVETRPARPGRLYAHDETRHPDVHSVNALIVPPSAADASSRYPTRP